MREKWREKSNENIYVFLDKTFFVACFFLLSPLSYTIVNVDNKMKSLFKISMQTVFTEYLLHTQYIIEVDLCVKIIGDMQLFTYIYVQWLLCIWNRKHVFTVFATLIINSCLKSQRIKKLLEITLGAQAFL